MADPQGTMTASAVGIHELLHRLPKKDSFWRTTFSRLTSWIQGAADFATVFFAYFGSFQLYTTNFFGGYYPESVGQFFWLSVAVSSIYVFILSRFGLYRRDVSLLNIKELRGLFYVGLYGAAIVFGILFYIRFTSFSRAMFTMAMVSAPILLFFQRQVLYQFHVRLHQMGWAQKRVLIYGAGKIGLQLAKRMFASPTLGFLPVAFMDDAKDKHGKVLRWQGIGPRVGVKIFASEEFENKVSELGVDLVVVAIPSNSFERNKELVEQCISSEIEYAVVPNSYEKFIQHVEMFEVGGVPLLRRKTLRVSWFYLAVKRLVDFLLSSLLIVALSPIALILTAFIKLDSKGVVFFKQKRVGLKGRLFSIYKFRTMREDAPKYALSPDGQTDLRVTRVGRWLRRTSLDELPQLFNVFRGDMSLVGPRPEMPFIVEQYSPLERRRLEAKPGITGVWQISADRGEPIHQNIEYDLFYLENRSFLLDVAILIKTAISVLKGVGAH